MISQVGRACRRFFTPGLVTLVPLSHNCWRCANRLRWSSPASVTLFSSRRSILRLVNPLRCSSPTSVIWVLFIAANGKPICRRRRSRNDSANGRCWPPLISPRSYGPGDSPRAIPLDWHQDHRRRYCPGPFLRSGHGLLGSDHRGLPGLGLGGHQGTGASLFEPRISPSVLARKGVSTLLDS